LGIESHFFIDKIFQLLVRHQVDREASDVIIKRTHRLTKAEEVVVNASSEVLLHLFDNRYHFECYSELLLLHSVFFLVYVLLFYDEVGWQSINVLILDDHSVNLFKFLLDIIQLQLFNSERSQIDFSIHPCLGEVSEFFRLRNGFEQDDLERVTLWLVDEHELEQLLVVVLVWTLVESYLWIFEVCYDCFGSCDVNFNGVIFVDKELHGLFTPYETIILVDLRIVLNGLVLLELHSHP
jgi:hypothetical protein